MRSERVVEPESERASRGRGPVGIAAVIQPEPEKQTAGEGPVVHDIGGAEPQAKITGMIGIRTQIVVCGLDPEPCGQIPPTCELEPVAVVAAAEIVHFVL